MQTSFVHRFHKTNQDLIILIISIQKKNIDKKIFSIQFKQWIRRGNQYDVIENRNYVYS